MNLIGLAQKAGRLAVGEEPTGAAARARDARLILVAADAAENTSLGSQFGNIFSDLKKKMGE